MALEPGFFFVRFASASYNERYETPYKTGTIRWLITGMKKLVPTEERQNGLGVYFTRSYASVNGISHPPNSVERNVLLGEAAGSGIPSHRAPKGYFPFLP